MDIKEKISEELPIKELYTDLVQPSARKLGKTAEDILKFVSLPFSFLGMTSEELEKKYKTFITSALNKIPEEKREKPSPLIAGPLLDHIKFLFNDKTEKPLEEMFSELLKNACNKDTKSYVQPSYIYILKQLTWIEATLLQLLFTLHNDDDWFANKCLLYYNTRSSKYSGKWIQSIYTKADFSGTPIKQDIYNIKHKKTNYSGKLIINIEGTISRSYPKIQSHRKWDIIGYLDGDILTILYQAQEGQKSRGCIYATDLLF